MAYMDYMDLDVYYPKKATKTDLTHSLTHSPTHPPFRLI